MLACVLACASCTNFFYNRIDNIAASHIRDLVTLRDDQNDALERWLGQTLQWHRHSELGRYREFLIALSSQAQQPQPSEVHARSAIQVEAFFNHVAARSAPEAARLLCTLDARQADEFITNLEKKDAEEREERAEQSPAERLRERTRRLQRQARKWLGRLSEQQNAIIAAHVRRLLQSDADFVSRAEWRTSLRAVLARGGQGCVSVAMVEQLLLDPARLRTAAYANEVAHNRRVSIELVTALDASLTPAQRQHLRDELAAWMRTLDSLLENA